MSRSFLDGGSLPSVSISEVFLPCCCGFATTTWSLTRSILSLGALAIGYLGTDLELGFKQCSFHPIMQVLRIYSFSAFSLFPAFPPCYCSLAFRLQVRRLTYRISSESYPGDQECDASYHGAGRP